MRIIIFIYFKFDHPIPITRWIYTTLTNFSTKYLVMSKVYTDVGVIN